MFATLPAWLSLTTFCLSFAEDLSVPAGFRRSLQIGGAADKFFSEHPRDVRLDGLKCTIKPLGNGSVISSVCPGFVKKDGSFYWGRTFGQQTRNVETVLAPDGYVVTSLRVKGGTLVDGFSIVFTKLDDGKLDPSKIVVSKWVGGRGGRPEVEIGDKGNVLTGLAGVHVPWLAGISVYETTETNADSLGILVERRTKVAKATPPSLPTTRKRGRVAEGTSPKPSKLGRPTPRPEEPKWVFTDGRKEKVDESAEEKKARRLIEDYPEKVFDYIHPNGMRQMGLTTEDRLIQLVYEGTKSTAKGFKLSYQFEWHNSITSMLKNNTPGATDDDGSRYGSGPRGHLWCFIWFEFLADGTPCDVGRDLVDPFAGPPFISAAESLTLSATDGRPKAEETATKVVQARQAALLAYLLSIKR